MHIFECYIFFYLSFHTVAINDFQPHQVNKKKGVYARHLGLKKNNLPTPQTQRLRIKEIYDNNDKKFNSIEEEGITSRVEKI